MLFSYIVITLFLPKYCLSYCNIISTILKKSYDAFAVRFVPHEPLKQIGVKAKGTSFFTRKQ